jgi:hypothetical protein
LAKVYKDG